MNTRRRHEAAARHGGAAVFRVMPQDIDFGRCSTMFSVTFLEPWVIQRFPPESSTGDKRIILVDGEFAGAVNRVPAPDEPPLQHGPRCAGRPRPLAARTGNLCHARPRVRERGLLFVGIDVIDGNLTEINVTSPTGNPRDPASNGPDVAAKIWIHRGRNAAGNNFPPTRSANQCAARRYATHLGTHEWVRHSAG